MGQTTTLTASDGFRTGAYVAKPTGDARGAIVVIQEIFGVNSHIRDVCDGYAKDGYVAIAPALFDRIERNIELGYDDASIARGRDLKGKSPDATALLDIEAARASVADVGKVGVVGYCWGGYLSWLAACRLSGFSAAAVYYGGGIGDVLGEKPKCPVIGHFGEKDAHIPMSAIEQWRAKHPANPVYVYPAGHGFNCDHRGSYDAPSAKTARERTLAFFRQHVG